MYLRLALLVLFALVLAEAGEYRNDRIQLKRRDNKCMTFDPKDCYYIKFTRCDDNNMYQSWYYGKGQIKSKHPKYEKWCVTEDNSDRGGNFLKLSPCNDRDRTQQWHYGRYLFKSLLDNRKCMDYCSRCGGKVRTKKCKRRGRKDQHYLLGPKCNEEPKDDEPPQDPKTEEDYWEQLIPPDAYEEPTDKPDYEEPANEDPESSSAKESDYDWYFYPDGY